VPYSGRYPRHRIRREETRVTESDENCAEDEICVDLKYVTRQDDTRTVISDMRVADAVARAKTEAGETSGEYAAEPGAEAAHAAAATTEQIIKIRVHSW